MGRRCLRKVNHIRLADRGTETEMVNVAKRFRTVLFQMFLFVPEFFRATKACCTCPGDCSTRNSCECRKASLTYPGMSFANACTEECSCTPTRCRNHLYAPVLGILEVKDTPTRGKGLFAEKDIAKGTCIGYYRGDLKVSNSIPLSYDMTLIHLIDDSKVGRVLFNQLPYKCLVIDAASTTSGGPIRYLNHQCYGSNVTAKLFYMRTLDHDIDDFPFYIRMVATRDIRAGEELTFNYKGTNGNKPINFTCVCSSCQRRREQRRRRPQRRGRKMTQKVLMARARTLFPVDSGNENEVRRLLIDVKEPRLAPSTGRATRSTTTSISRRLPGTRRQQQIVHHRRMQQIKQQREKQRKQQQKRRQRRQELEQRGQ